MKIERDYSLTLVLEKFLENLHTSLRILTKISVSGWRNGGERGNRIVCGRRDKSDFLAKFHFYPSAVFLRRLLRRKEVGSGISLVVAGGFERTPRRRRSSLSLSLLSSLLSSPRPRCPLAFWIGVTRLPSVIDRLRDIPAGYSLRD